MDTVEFVAHVSGDNDRIERGLIVGPGIICAPAYSAPWGIYHHPTGLAMGFFDDAEACAAAGREVGVLTSWVTRNPQSLAADKRLRDNVERVVRRFGGWFTANSAGQPVIRNEVA